MKQLRCNRGFVSVTGKRKSFEHGVSLLMQATVNADLALRGGHAAPRSASTGPKMSGRRSARVTAPFVADSMRMAL